MASIGQAGSTLLIALCGIALVRLLPTDDYALLAICTTALVTLNALCDSGLVLAVTKRSGQHLGDRTELGRILASGFRIRRTFLLITAIPVSVVLAYLLHSHGASLPIVAVCTVLTVLTSITTLNTNLHQVPVQIYQRLAPLQILAVVAQAARLFLYVACLYFFPLVGMALAIGFATQWAISFVTERMATTFAAPKTPFDPRVESDLIQSLWRSVPTAIFYSLTAGLPMWILSFLGSTTSVAEFGGLTRIVSLQTLFVAIFSMVLVPRFAGLPDRPDRLGRFFLGSIGLALAGTSAFVGAVTLAADPVLSALGPEFSGLKAELTLYCVAGGISVVYALVYGLNSARGWLPKPIVFVPVCLATQSVAAYVIAPRTTEGAIILALVMPLPALGFLIFEAWCGVFRHTRFSTEA